MGGYPGGGGGPFFSAEYRLGLGLGLGLGSQQKLCTLGAFMSLMN